MQIDGGTDNTAIGNVGDRLKVDTIITPGTGTIPSVNKNLRYEDMNATTGGIARTTLVGASFVQVYSYSGSGILISVLCNLENKDKWYVRLVIDGEEIFGAAGIFTGDLIADDAYDLDGGGSPLSSNEGRIGVSMEEHDRFVWTAPSSFPIRYQSSVKVFIKRSDASTKKFYAGLAVLTKDT